MRRDHNDQEATNDLAVTDNLSTNISRRRFGQLVALGTAGVVLGAVSRPKGAAAAAPGYIYRKHGVSMTSAYFSEFADCMYRGEYDLKKVVTGLPLRDSGGWTDTLRQRVLWEIPGQTIVRTVTGDGTWGNQGYNGNLDDGNTYPNPERAVAEIGPWYAQRSDVGGIWVELGNEPNIAPWVKEWLYGDRNKAEQYVWNWQYWWDQARGALKAAYPNIWIISPGLQYDGSARWTAICTPVFGKVRFQGFHVFANFDFRDPRDNGDKTPWATKVMNEMSMYYPGKDWICTEYGINGQREPDANDPAKGRKYAELVHFGGSTVPWPANVKGAVYFHLDTRPIGQGYRLQYNIYEGGGDWAYRDRVNIG